MNDKLEHKEDVIFIDTNISSHKIIMAAEQSRHNGGVLVEVGSFIQE